MKFVLLAMVLASSGATPIEVGRLVTGPTSSVELTNTAAQPVTAWSFAVVTPTPGGAHRVVETIDGYLSEATEGLPGSSPRTSRLRPGETRTIALDPVAAGAHVEIVAAVLDDGTAFGDEKTIDAIFDLRVKERDELQMVVQAFDDVLGTEHGTAALEALRARFNAASSGSGPREAARQAVDSYQRRATPANADDIDRVLRNYAAVVRREYELAKKHAVRKRS